MERKARRISPTIGLLAGIATVAVFAAAAGARAQTVQNGNFTSFTSAPSAAWSELGVANAGLTPALTGWTVPGSGIACVVQGATITAYNGTTSSTAICGTNYGGPTANPNGGTLNPSYATLWATPGSPPVTGYTGNIVVADADNSYHENISQTLTGLTAGQAYSVTFYQAGVQQTGYTGGYSDWFQLTIGGVNYNSTQMTVNSEAMAPWQKQVINFTATSTSEVLTFLAQSNDAGSNEPPMVLLAGVSMAKAPEPASIALFGAGVSALGLLRRRKRSVAAAAA